MSTICRWNRVHQPRNSKLPSNCLSYDASHDSSQDAGLMARLRQERWSCQRTPLIVRMRCFCKTVCAGVLWRAGCGVPSLAAQQRVSTLENRWLPPLVGERTLEDRERVTCLRETQRGGHKTGCGDGHSSNLTHISCANPGLRSAHCTTEDEPPGAGSRGLVLIGAGKSCCSSRNNPGLIV